ncbi:hypothetical protein L1049_013092 [Liquidambar formosana]|uniref:Bifunctional inhibitor/plant lipid transfer protein/seed storage helical domain-containing protein n=1 Tax=Liquidambar formosana TaxID=63359 RepID=A0AAP0WXF1_LIQFO
MATTRITIVLLVVLLMAIHGVSAQSPAMAPAPVVAMVPSVAQGPEAAMVPAAAGPSTDCMTYIYNMTDCLSYVESGSNLTEPDKPCCGELAALVDNNPICLCQLLSSADSLGLQIDVSKSLKLPSVCGVSTPSVSLCSAVGYPVAAPTSNDESVSPGDFSLSLLFHIILLTFCWLELIFTGKLGWVAKRLALRLGIWPN